MKLAYLDTETTGVDPYRHGIWQLCLYIEIDNKVVAGFRMEVAPFETDELDDEAVALSGRTVEQLRALTNPVAAYRELIKFLDRYVNRYDPADKFTVVGYNSKFDVDFLRRWFAKADPVSGKFYGSYFTPYTIDIYTLTGLLKYLGVLNLPNLKQETVASHWGIVYDAHRADEDIKAARKVFRRCLEELPAAVSAYLQGGTGGQ